AVGDLDPSDGPFVVTDVGGGSTEVVVGDVVDGKATIWAAESVDIGSVRITERCLPGDPPSPQEVAEARRLAVEVLAEAFAEVPVSSARTWVGVAGTVTSLSAIAQRLPRYDPDAVHLS